VGKEAKQSDMKAGKITFGLLRKTDLPLMHKWLNTPHVSEWWEVDGKRNPSQDEIRRKYWHRINGKEPVTCYIITCNGKPIGMVQSCLLDDYPAEKEAFGLDQSCAGIDILIGEENYVHQGLGSNIIKKFLKEIVFTSYDVTCCIVDPDPQNEAAIKAYRKAGFEYLKTVWNLKDAVYAYIMSVNRDAFSPKEEETKRRAEQYRASKRGEAPLPNTSPSPDNLARRGGHRGRGL
jgi:aminoglycoside 6'-N-acetyltransferase